MNFNYSNYFTAFAGIIIILIGNACDSLGDFNQNGNGGNSFIDQHYNGPQSDQLTPFSPSQVEIAGENLGTLLSGASHIVYLLITNNSQHVLENLNVHSLFGDNLQFNGGIYPGRTGDCTQTLATGLTCSVALEITPTQSAISAYATVSYLANNRHQSKSLFLNGVTRDAGSISVQNLIFPQTAIGTTNKEPLTLRNLSLTDTAQNITITQAVGSQFTITNPTACTSIPALGSCYLDVEFSPTYVLAQFFENITISYDIAGVSKLETLSALASSIDHTNLTITAPTIPLGRVIFNKRAAIEIKVKKTLGSLGTAADFNLANIPAGFKLDTDPSKSTCLDLKYAPGKQHMQGYRNNTCVIILKTDKIIANKTLATNVDVTYQAGSIAKSITVPLNGSINLTPLQVSGNTFGALTIATGFSQQVTLTVSSPNNSSMINAKNFRVIGLNTGVTQVNSQSTCLTPGTTLAPNSSCKLVFDIKAPATSNPTYNHNLAISYESQGQTHLLNTTLMGNITVKQPSLSTHMSVTHDPFPASTKLGSSFSIKATVANKSYGLQASSANNLSIDKIAAIGAAATSWWIASDELQKDITNTTCTAGNLSSGSTCVFAFTITPKNSTSNFERFFRIKFTDSLGNTDSLDFAVKGNIVVSAKTVSILKSAVDTNNTNAPTIVSTTTAAHPNYLYNKREVVQAPINLTNYPAWAWTRTASQRLNHIPWTFKLGTAKGTPEKLVDIVPDRIVDPVTGTRYVRLWHGTTSDNLTIFSVGSANIRFDVATITALGQGFYLAASANESKNYACTRYKDRKKVAPHKTNPNFKALLLEIGIQEDDDIIGITATSAISDIITGLPLSGYEDLFFNRNSTMTNQFVFINQPQLHQRMRIFNIYELGTNFGMAPGYDDHDGKPVGDTTPDTDLRYKCTY